MDEKALERVIRDCFSAGGKPELVYINGAVVRLLHDDWPEVKFFDSTYAIAPSGRAYKSC